MSSFKIILGALFVSLITSIAILGFLAYKSNQASNDAYRWVEHSRRVLEETEMISSSFKAIQLESNALFITGDKSLIDRYTAAKKSLSSGLGKLKLLVSDNDSQEEKIRNLENLVATMIAFTDSTLSNPGSRLDEQVLRARMLRGNTFRAQIQKLIDDIWSEEKALLTGRQVANDESMMRFNTTFITLLVGIVALVGATFVLIRHNFNNLIKTEKALKKANELFFKLFYEAPVAFIITKPEEGMIVDCNTVYAELVNHDRSSLIGKTARQMGIIGSDFARDEFVQKVRQEGTVKDMETMIYPKDKPPVWVESSVQMIRLADGEFLLSALIDISSHKKAEADILSSLNKEMELNKLKSNFVSLASHEFRTPLTAVLSSASLLESYADGENKDKMKKHITRIKSSVTALTGILDEFLSLTRIEEGKMSPNCEHMNVRDFLTSICSALQSYTKPGQVIDCRHAGHTHAYSDPVLFTNIVTNLVSNAIKYSPDGSRISIYSEVDEYFILTVADEGIGIPKADQEYLFSRFYRASNAGNVQGTGLGLHITRHFVELLGGTVTLSSDTGAGTEFKLVFPNRALQESNAWQ